MFLEKLLKDEIKKKGSASYRTALFLSIQEFFQKHQELF